MKGTGQNRSCAVSEWNINEWHRKKGLEVICSTGTRACEYRVGGYWIGSAINSFPLLAPSHIDYSKVKWSSQLLTFNKL